MRGEKRTPALFLTLAVLLALAGLGIHSLAAGPGEEYTMPELSLIVSSDLHYIAPSLTDHGEYFENMIRNADGKAMDYIEELTDAFLAQVIEARPAALILSGDLTLNGARESHEALARKLAAVSEAGIPVLVMPGNHDLDRRDAARFHGDGFTRVESIDAAAFAGIYAGCGFEGACSRDGASLSYVYEPVPGLRILMLDVNTAEAPQAVKPETLAWAEGQLSDAAKAGARVIAVSHQNVYKHNAAIYEGYLIKNSGALLALYERYGVLVNLSGHLHCQHIAREGDGLYEIATGSLAVYPNQFGVLTMGAERLDYRTRVTDVSGWAAARGLTDPALLDFPAYARDFFTGSGRTQTRELPEAANDFFARLNTAYFSGRMDLIDPGDPGFALWDGQGFQGVYVESLRADAGHDYTKLSIPIQ